MFSWLFGLFKPTISQIIIADMMREQREVAADLARRELTDVYVYTPDRLMATLETSGLTVVQVRGRYYVLVGAFQRNIKESNQYMQLLDDRAPYGTDDSGVYLKYESVLTGAFLAKIRSAVTQPGGISARAEKISKLLAKETWTDGPPSGKSGPKPKV